MPTSYRVVASPAWLRATLGGEASRLSDPADLGAHRCVLIDLAGHRSEWRWRKRGTSGAKGPSGKVRVAGDVRCSSALAVRRCALDGVGPALLADWLIGDDLASGSLVDLCPCHELGATEFDAGAWLVYPSREWLPGKTRAMIDFLKAHVEGATSA